MLSIIWYYILVMAFAGIIVWASNIDNDCVKVGGNNLGDLERSKLMDAFSLSWSTFSTVGYGSTYPALSTETWNATATDKFDGNRDETCSFISFICVGSIRGCDFCRLCWSNLLCQGSENYTACRVSFKLVLLDCDRRVSWILSH